VLVLVLELPFITVERQDDDASEDDPIKKEPPAPPTEALLKPFSQGGDLRPLKNPAAD
jgi:hypothetical protein